MPPKQKGSGNKKADAKKVRKEGAQLCPSIIALRDMYGWVAGDWACPSGWMHARHPYNCGPRGLSLTYMHTHPPPQTHVHDRTRPRGLSLFFTHPHTNPQPHTHACGLSLFLTHTPAN